MAVIAFIVGKRERVEREPLISVVMATYNDRPKYLKNSIKSVLCQTYRNFEFIILDDSDKEESKDIIDSFSSDKRINIIRKKEKMGFVRALNTGLKAAKGTYIARMDGDDIAVPERFSMQMNYLKNHPKIDVIGGQIEIINAHGDITGFRRYPQDGLRLYLYATMRNPVPHPSVMFRKKIVDEGFFYNEKQQNAEDLDLWLRLINTGHRFANLPEVTLQYRVDSDFIEKRLKNGKRQDVAVIDVTKRHATLKRPIFYGCSMVFCAIRGRMSVNMRKRLYERENEARG